MIFAYAKTKAQISCPVTGQLISAFVFRYIDTPYLRFKPLHIDCGCRARFWSDLVGPPKTGFLARLLIFASNLADGGRKGEICEGEGRADTSL